MFRLVQYNDDIRRVQEDEFTLKRICLHFYFSFTLSVRVFQRSVIQVKQFNTEISIAFSRQTLSLGLRKYIHHEI